MSLDTYTFLFTLINCDKGPLSTERSNTLRDYEMLLLIRPTLDAESASDIGKQTGELITANAGSIDSTNMWGRRKLAYQINNFNEATYTLIKFKLDPAKLRDLEFELKLNESLLRYLIIRDLHPQSTELKDDEASEDTPEASEDTPEGEVDAPEETSSIDDAASVVAEATDVVEEASTDVATEVADAAEDVANEAGEETETVADVGESSDSVGDSSEEGTGA